MYVCLNTTHIQQVLYAQWLQFAPLKAKHFQPRCQLKSYINFHVFIIHIHSFIHSLRPTPSLWPDFAVVRANVHVLLSFLFVANWFLSSNAFRSCIWTQIRKSTIKNSPTSICYHLCCAIFTYGYENARNFTWSIVIFLLLLRRSQRKSFYLHHAVVYCHRCHRCLSCSCCGRFAFLMPLACIYQYIIASIFSPLRCSFFASLFLNNTFASLFVLCISNTSLLSIQTASYCPMCAVHLAGNVMLNSVYNDGKQCMTELKRRREKTRTWAVVSTNTT